MTDAEKREAARQFAIKWAGKGKEDEDGRSFWIDILQDVLGLDNVTDRVEFEKKVVGYDGNVKRIDAYIPETRVLIEQKSLGIALDKSQAGHGGKTPYEQAKEYADGLPFDEKPRWIVTCNFSEIWIYDMNQKKPWENILIVTTSELQTKYPLLAFLYKDDVKKITEEMELSLKAGELVGKIHDRFLEQYHDPMAKKTQNSLNILCVRLVFCLYAEDAGLFGSDDAFIKYISKYEPGDIRRALLDLFKVLDTPIEKRPELYLSDELEAFPYVNGGLFEREHIEIPKITQEIKDTLIESALFDWSKISPTIFGAVFESTLNPETRRSGGMHYTSIENIHKVIDPLFLDDLKEELEKIKELKVKKTRENRLRAYQEKLASIKWLDPACGSGNFLTETYLSVRRLENDVISNLQQGQITFGFDTASPIKVSIDQFYGIEINDFAVTVAKAALWIAESQMMKETEDVVHMPLDFLPLKTNAHIVEGNALRMDWGRVVPKNELNYIMGNPPFVGYAYQNQSQKDDLKSIIPKTKNIDYVSGWYFKAADYMKDTDLHAAFVSTNSITQGEQVSAIWKPLMNKYQLSILFAHQTFQWDSEANIKAHVHCVIIGFVIGNNSDKKILFNGNGDSQIVDNINGYLTSAPTVFITKRTKPICNISSMHRGSQPTDNGNFIFTVDEYNNFIKEEPYTIPLFKKYMMGKDFINRKPRYCLWLKDISPSLIKKSKSIMERIENVRIFRLNSSKAATRRKADTPTLFDEIQQPSTDFVALPKVSSERRRYVPMEFMSPETVVGDKIYIIENATMYEFGVMESNVHMAWMRTVCGRLEMRYSYSNTIVYNNFPWPSPTDQQKAQIEKTAQGILDARDLYPDSSLADLYDPLTMPPELRKAHQLNDKAVMQAYGFDIKNTSEADCVAHLMRMYQELTQDK